MVTIGFFTPTATGIVTKKAKPYIMVAVLSSCLILLFIALAIIEQIILNTGRIAVLKTEEDSLNLNSALTRDGNQV